MTELSGTRFASLAAVKTALHIAVAIGCLLHAACGDEIEELDPDDPSKSPIGQPNYDTSDWLFEPTEITTVDIEIDPADWDELRFQTRSFVGALAGECQAQPFSKPWTYFPASVTVNGQLVENVGVRKKGFIGSLSTTKPSLKIKFDEYVSGQEFSGIERLTLNNQRQDPSLINACLGYHVFRNDGVAAPRCNFARVSVNGVELGVYAHVDSLKKRFVRRNFTDSTGNLWEGTLSDFRTDWTGTFEIKTNEEQNPSDPSDLEAALLVPDDQLLAAVGDIVDLERFYRFWALETLTGHWDGYSGNTNNFYFYRDPTTNKIEFIPWGADALFRQRFTPYASVQAAGQLTRRLYLHPQGQTAYLSAVTDVLDTVWNEGELVAEATRMQDLIRPHVAPDAVAVFNAEIDGTRDYINGKRAAVEAELALGPPEWTQPLREDFCFDKVGDFSLTIDTIWNGGVGNPGTGTLTYDIEGLPSNVTNVASIIGPNNNNALAFLSGDLDDGTQMLFRISMPSAEVRPGGSATIDWLQATGELFLTPPGGQATLVARVAKGGVAVTAGSTVDGQPVQLGVVAELFATTL